MCLNVLRCMGVTTVDKSDYDVEETATRRHAPVEEAAARIYPSGKGQLYPRKSDKRSPHRKDEEAAAATSKVQKEAARAAATSDSGSERSPVKAKKEYSPAADQFDEYAVVAGQPSWRGYDEGLIRGAAVPAGAPTYPAGQHKTAYGARDAYTVIVIPPIYADEATVKSISTSQEQGTGRRGQLKTREVGDGAGRSRRLEEAGFGSDQ